MYAHGLLHGAPMGMVACMRRGVSARCSVQVSAGAAHTLFVTARGELWGAGCSEERQLALDDPADVPGPCPVPGLPADRPVRFAVAAGDHSIAVLESAPHQNGINTPPGGPPDHMTFPWAARGSSSKLVVVVFLRLVYVVPDIEKLCHLPISVFLLPQRSASELRRLAGEQQPEIAT